MTVQGIIRDLYDSGIEFEVTCNQAGGFCLRLIDPDVGFSPVAAESYADVLEQLCAMAVHKYPESGFAKKYAAFILESPPLSPETSERELFAPAWAAEIAGN